MKSSSACSSSSESELEPESSDCSSPMLVTKLMFSSDSEYEQEAKKKKMDLFRNCSSSDTAGRSVKLILSCLLKRDLSSDCSSSDRDSESEPELEKKKKKASFSVEKRSGKRCGK